MRRCSSSTHGHAVRPKSVRGVGEDENGKWEKLAERLKATKKKDTEGEEQENGEEEIGIQEDLEDGRPSTGEERSGRCTTRSCRPRRRSRST